MSKRASFGTLVFIGLLPLSVSAQDAPAPTPVDDDVQHRVSITFSPIHLSLPIVELTGEYRVDDKMGAALIVGAGTVDGYNAYEVGAQYRYYVLGSFIHGLQVGAELLYLSIDDTEGNVTASGNGLAIGPFVGYKIASNLGFTFDLQAGAQYLAMQAEAEVGSASASDEDSDIIPLLNLNFGWSF